MAVILMTEEYWKNSQFSVAQYYGGMVFNGSHYSIVNKEGIPVVELSDPGSPHYVKGNMVIQPGEPCDLILDEWIPVYKRLGRERTIELIKNNTSLENALLINLK
ncbi:MAG: hypothetical protein IJW56_00020 [Bacteroides sp.]|nr:hypothetical protein [Bacteroides sp.]MBR2497740.1 hypothetical protein [Parabacteroides sp.]